MFANVFVECNLNTSTIYPIQKKYYNTLIYMSYIEYVIFNVDMLILNYTFKKKKTKT